MPKFLAAKDAFLDRESANLHLYHQPRKTKKWGVVDNYSLATSYRDEEGRSKKDVVFRLGSLDRVQASQCRVLLKALNSARKGLLDPSMVMLDLSDVTIKSERDFFGVLVLSKLWDRLGLSGIFSSTKDPREKLGTCDVAKILTINRLLSPSSKLGTIDWFHSTYLGEVMEVESQGYNRNKIFRELKKIHSHKSQAEKHFLRFSLENETQKVRVYYFDGTTSWFEGIKCKLAARDKEKTRGIYDQVLSLMLITDVNGYPIAWEAVDGNRKDVSELEGFVKRVCEAYGIDDVTYCFDRGVSSQSNYKVISSRGSKFISGIRDDQIKNVFDLHKFRHTREELLGKKRRKNKAQNANPRPESQRRVIAGVDGFYTLGKHTFYRDLGVIDGHRYIASFNVKIFEKERAKRDQNIKRTLAAVSKKNADLQIAKRSRDFNATERDLLAILQKHKVGHLFTYRLLPIISTNKVDSFNIELSLSRENLEKTELTDGLLVYITNHIEKEKNDRFILDAADIVGHYRAKYVIENAFREMKSFIDLRPFHVRVEDHVRAHYDICVYAYFINNFIYKTLKVDDVGVRPFYRKLREFSNAVELESSSGQTVVKRKLLDTKMTHYLASLGLDNIISVPHTSQGAIR